jgi:hypothetical protein
VREGSPRKNITERVLLMAGDWHYTASGQRHGPISSVELKQLAATGQISPADLVWKEGLANWVAASSIKGLFSPISSPPPLPPAGKEKPVEDDLKPKVEAAARATADAAKAAMKSVAGLKPVAGFHIQRAGLGAAALLGCLCTFLPWFTAPILGTVYGTAGDGWITLILFIPALVFAAIGDRLEPIVGWKRFAASVPPLLASLVGLGKIIDLNSRLGNMKAELAGNPFGPAVAKMAAATLQTRFGLYLLVLVGPACVAAVFLLKGAREHDLRV